MEGVYWKCFMKSVQYIGEVPAGERIQKNLRRRVYNGECRRESILENVEERVYWRM